MPLYKPLREKSPENKRTIEKLKILRKALHQEVPKKTHSEHLLLATWNIRDFDKPAYGGRLSESNYYIAEIIARFDIVCIQEVYRDLRALNRVIDILGSGWGCLFSDATEGRRGNDERMAYVYDKSKVRFSGLAGELVIPPIIKKDGQGKDIVVPAGQAWRTPMLAGFTSGWAKFILCSVHILWGDGKANSPERIKEITHIAEFLKARSLDETAWAKKLILLGDFNIFSKRDKTYQKLEENGYTYPKALEGTYKKGSGTNAAKSKKHYDHILFREREHGLEVVRGGVFEPFNSVFTDSEEDIYKEYMLKPYKNANDEDAYYKSYSQWRTHQMSDHNPLWVEFKVDFSDDYLDYLEKQQ